MPAIEQVAPPPADQLIAVRPAADPVAALGLVACSLITLKGATRNAMPGQPLYYVERQGIYAGSG